MFTTITSGALCGIESYLVQVEVDTAQGLPGFEMVGMLGSEVKEARERVRVALRNTGFSLLPLRVTVNLSPADIRKEGTAFDLPIAVGILASVGKIWLENVKGMLFLGELGLNGEIKPVRGVLPILLEAREKGIACCVLPQENIQEARAVRGIRSVGMRDLRELTAYLELPPEERKKAAQRTCDASGAGVCEEGRESGAGMCAEIEGTEWDDSDKEAGEPDFADISGQPAIRRAVEIAAAGFHHLLLVGPPGCGKTMIAKRIPSVLPPLSFEESLEVSKIYSAAGLLHPKQPLIKKRPFLNPHHTITQQALAGGGRIPKPGVISLAHRGVLFLDELPEFGREAIEVLRQPLEERTVHIARNCGSYTYPADFMLVAALNPCPCGYYPDRSRCQCTPGAVRRYISRISGPILDRIDICVEAPRLSAKELAGAGGAESSAAIRERVMRARERQANRFEGTPYRFNTDLGVGELKKYCPLGVKEQQLLDDLFRAMQLSARAYHRIVRLARTIADLDGCDEIREKHISEAACYRLIDGRYWENGGA